MRLPSNIFALDASERRARLYPVVVHAIALLEEAGAYDVALDYASTQLNVVPIKQFRHWAGVYAVLSGQVGGQA